MTRTMGREQIDQVLVRRRPHAVPVEQDDRSSLTCVDGNVELHPWIFRCGRPACNCTCRLEQ